MHYSEIKTCDIANGTGARTSLFVSGCRNKCPGCFNSETWDFNHGKEFTDETLNYIFDTLEPDHIEGLSILGGEPFEPENQYDILNLIEKFRYAYPRKDVWIWTGFTWEDIFTNEDCRANTLSVKKILRMTDILVDGPFIEDKKDMLLRFRGSSNQRIIDVEKSIQAGGNVVLWTDGPILSTHTWQEGLYEDWGK